MPKVDSLMLRIKCEPGRAMGCFSFRGVESMDFFDGHFGWTDLVASCTDGDLSWLL